MPTLSPETKHALKAIHTYLAGENEAVQYSLQYLADLVTSSSSGITGGIQAGSVPANDVVTDPSPEVFTLNAAATGASSSPLSLDLKTGDVTATWTADGSTVNVSGTVNCVESSTAPSRFLFVIHEPSSGFYALTTTNI
jgi:hypothetical protein